MDKAIRSIPKDHLNEFLKEQTILIRSRLKLAALLLVVCVVVGDIIGMFALHQRLISQMKLTWILSAALSAVTLLLSRKISTFRLGKIAAALFAITVLIVMAKDSIGNEMPPFDVAMIFIFMFFGFALVFPWSANEVIAVSLAHFAAYTVYILNAPEYMYKNDMVATALPDYLDGFIVMFLASIVCCAVIRRDRRRDIENFILLKDVEEKNNQIQQNLRLAGRVHSRLIPHSESNHLADIAVTYVPVDYMGGDYAKFHFLDKNRLIFIICDVTGHGVSAALLVNALNTEFERLAKEGKSPGYLLKEMNSFIISDFAGINMYLSAFCGLLDYSGFSRKFTYSSYGHLPQYIYHPANSAIEKLPAQASLLGLPVKDENVYENAVPFARHDQIILFTDGVTEARNSQDKQYGPARLEDFISSNHNLPAELFNKSLLGELKSFTGNKFNDDIFILTIQTK